MNWLKLGTYILIVIPTLFVGIVIGFYLIQDYMIFLGERLPEDHKYSFKLKFQEINFENPEGYKINALLFKAENSKGLIYYHHGNAGNLQGWGNYAGSFVRLGYDVLFYDYRGYGKSESRIKSQNNLLDDAKFILDSIRSQYEGKILVFYGSSLGTGIAVKLAVDENPDALILETPYFNFCALIHHHYPYLPAKLMSKYKLRTDKYIKEVACQILLFHGTDDQIVPHEHSDRLQKLNNSVKLVSIKNGVHNNLSDFKIYHQELRAFLDGILISKSDSL